MVGRKGAVQPSDIINSVLKFKERVVLKNEKNEFGIVAATNEVWSDIRLYIGDRMTSNAIHTFVQKGRHGIMEKLGFPSKSKQSRETVHSTSILPDDESADEYSSNNEDVLPCKKFVFTFSSEEWDQIQPQEKVFKLTDKSRPMQSTRSYYVLPKGTWTPILAEHFWAHFQLPCCLSFRRGKVYPSGSVYIHIVGRCSVCDSRFNGTVFDKPPGGAKVLMHCTFRGNFQEAHETTKKRRLIGPAMEKAISSICVDGLSSETYREREAVRLIKIGAPDPSIIPSGNSLRILKSRMTAGSLRHEDTLTSLALMKQEDDFKNIMHDIGCDPFFLHYHCADQIQIYRNYCKGSRPKLIIDATGSVVKKFLKLSKQKTSSIFLYEGLVYDPQNQCSFTVTNMLSERHNSLAISNWLSSWINCDVPRPKETVCDQSMALLSAIAKTFTQFTTLQDYIIICADLLTKKIDGNSHLLPYCFMRIDVAHFVKTCSKWIPLKTIPRRVKEVILRSIGVLIKSQSLTEIKSMLLSLFVVITNETAGNNMHTHEETPCEKHKQIVLKATSTGFVDFEQQYEDIISTSEDEAKICLEEEYARSNEGLDKLHNPFEEWAKEIYENSKLLIQEGTEINPLFIPSLVPILVKCMKLLPLWSGVMIPVFNYGEQICSSAAVESSFKKLKTVTMKNVVLPTNIEIFLENHIMSLKGASLIRIAKNQSSLSPYSTTEEVEDQYNTYLNNSLSFNLLETKNDNDQQALNDPLLTRTLSPSFVLEKFNNYDENEALIVVDAVNEQTNLNYEITLIDELCSKSSNENVLNVLNENMQVDVDIENDRQTSFTEENAALEEWNRKSLKQRKSCSYLVPNPHLRYLNLKNSNKIQSLPILKNGSRFQDLKSSRTVKNTNRIVLSNTCAFDALSSILMVSYCDSQVYSMLMDSLNNDIYFNFISSLVKNGITSSTYTKRTEVIMHYLKPELTLLQYNITLAKCDATMGYVMKALLKDYPTIEEFSKCSSDICIKTSKRQVMYLTYQTENNGNLNGLQHFIKERTGVEYLECIENCGGIKTVHSKISTHHLFIDVLQWEGNDLTSSMYSTEAANMVQIKLCDIPQILVYESTTYELRGAIHFYKGKSGLRNSIGHYTAYAKRGTHNWELYDDLKKRPIPVKETSLILCEFLIYTI